MTALVATAQPAALDAQRHALAAIGAALGQMTDPADVNEVRARVEAARAWAKVHKQTKNLRLDLLKVEVEALVRLAELDGTGLLTASEAKAATALAAMTPDERDAMLREYGSASTAAGVWRAMVRADEDAAAYREEVATWSRRFSESATDGPTLVHEHEWIGEPMARVTRRAVRRIVEDHVYGQEPFTPQDIVDELVAGLGEIPDAVTDGLRAVARGAILSAPTSEWGDTVIPSTITTTVDTEDGPRFMRIPVANARVSDVEQMVAYRREQVRLDLEALERLEVFLRKLAEVPGSHPGANVGDLIAGAAVEDVKSAA